MIFRRGGSSDLGLQCRDTNNPPRSWAAWGVPGWMGPSSLREWLVEQEWLVEKLPSEPRTFRGPWKFTGSRKDAECEEFAYQMTYDDGKIRNLHIVPWRTVRRPEQAEKLCGVRWYHKDLEYPEKEEEQEITPTVPFTAEIAQTVPDFSATDKDNSPNDEDMEDDGKKTGVKCGVMEEEKTKRTKLKTTDAAVSRISGGMAGPDGTIVRDLGGEGDCGWRAAAWLLAMVNSKWTADPNKLYDQLDKYAKVLQTQCVNHLTARDTSWQSGWAPDPQASELTESGTVPQTIETFCEALSRPKRWICHYGLQAIATAKKCVLVIWRREGDAWMPGPSGGSLLRACQGQEGGQHVMGERGDQQ